MTKKEVLPHLCRYVQDHDSPSDRSNWRRPRICQELSPCPWLFLQVLNGRGGWKGPSANWQGEEQQVIDWTNHQINKELATATFFTSCCPLFEKVFSLFIGWLILFMTSCRCKTYLFFLSRQVRLELRPATFQELVPEWCSNDQSTAWWRADRCSRQTRSGTQSWRRWCWWWSCPCHRWSRSVSAWATQSRTETWCASTPAESKMKKKIVGENHKEYRGNLTSILTLNICLFRQNRDAKSQHMASNLRQLAG